MFTLLLETLRTESVDVVPTKFGVRPSDKYMNARDFTVGVTMDQTKFYVCCPHLSQTTYNVISRFETPETAARATVALLKERLGIVAL